MVAHVARVDINGMIAKLVERGGEVVEWSIGIVAGLPEIFTVEGGIIAVEVLLLALVDWEDRSDSPLSCN